MLHSGEWLAKKYASLAQPKATQTLDTTLITLASRLQSTKSEGVGGTPSSSSTALPPLADRRAAVLTLKGLARDHPTEVGKRALDGLLECLCRDAREDDEIARALVETCLTLCEATAAASSTGAATTTITHKGKEVTLPAYTVQHVERFLVTSQPLHALLPLLSPSLSFYTRFSALQLLGSLVRIRSERVQEHVLTSPGGCGAILECLSDSSSSSAEIVRNEALLLLPQLVVGNADIQKLVAFEGAFEKLIDVVAVEGRIEGGVVVQDALEALVALLQYNVSNQNYFRETLSVPLLAPLLFYPPPPPPNDRHAEEEYVHQLEAFAFQQWYPPVVPMGDEDGEGQQQQERETTDVDEQKVINASLVLDVAGLLVEGQGESKRLNQNALLACGFTQCLVELSLASTAPVSLRSHALRVLGALLRASRSNQEVLQSLEVSPIISVRHVHEAERSSDVPLAEYTRLPTRSALLEVVGAVVNGTAKGTSALQSLAFRTAALGCFEAYVDDHLDARLNVIRTMAFSAQDTLDRPMSEAGTGPLILRHLARFPSLPASANNSEAFDAYNYLLSAMLFASLIRGSETAKRLAQGLLFGPDDQVVAHVDVENEHVRQLDDEDEDERNSLLQVLLGNFAMALREHGEATRRERGAGSGSKGQIHGNAGSPTDWTRVQVGYLTVLITWLWESQAAVVEMLRESSNLQVLIQPVSQGNNMIDPIVAGLCAVALGIAYEFGPVERGEEASQKEANEGDLLTRTTLYPILHSRVGPDQFAARLTRLRDDVRFKLVEPDVLEIVALTARQSQQQQPNVRPGGAGSSSSDESHGLWFDWPLVDFIKTNYVSIQRSILVEPNTTSASQAAQSTELLDARRQLEQVRELHGKVVRDNEQLRQKLSEEDQSHSVERANLLQALSVARSDVDTIRQELHTLQSSVSQDQQRVNQSEESARHAAEVSALEGRIRELEQAKASEEGQRRGVEAELQRTRQQLDDAERRAYEAQREAADVARALTEKKANGGVEANGEEEKSKAELEKELEDLLILLDELSTKRKRDKESMRSHGFVVSEDEDDEDEFA